MSGAPREDGFERDEDEEEEDDYLEEEEEEESEKEEEVVSRVSLDKSKRDRSKGSSGERNVNVETMVRSLQQEGELKGTAQSK